MLQWALKSQLQVNGENTVNIRGKKKKTYLTEPSCSQLGQFWPQGISVVTDGRVLLASGRQRTRILLNILQCIVQPPQHRSIRIQMSRELGLRSPDNLRLVYPQKRPRHHGNQYKGQNYSYHITLNHLVHCFRFKLYYLTNVLCLYVKPFNWHLIAIQFFFL